jgi:hypothetical protein
MKTSRFSIFEMHVSQKARYVNCAWVWFYYSDFVTESGVTASILVGAVSRPREAPSGRASYAAARAPWLRVTGAVRPSAASG